MPNDLVVLGRKVGTYSHWDQFDEVGFVFYEFEPIAELNVFPGAFSLDYTTGIFTIKGESEVMVASGDLLTFVKDLPRDDEEPVLVERE